MEIGTQLIIASLVMFVGSLIQGATGFGFAIFSVPILVLFLPMQTVAVLVLLMSLTVVLQLAFRTRHFVNLRLMGPVVVGALIGRTFGLHLLITLESSALRVILGALLVILAVYFCFFSEKLTIKPSRTNGVAAGLVSGVFGGMFNIGGPPQVVFYFAATPSVEEYQGCRQATNLITALYSVGLHLVYGTIDRSILGMASLGAIAVTIGAYLGFLIFKVMNRASLSRAISVIMGIMGVLMILGR